jgi:hypothetical protein
MVQRNEIIVMARIKFEFKNPDSSISPDFIVRLMIVIAHEISAHERYFRDTRRLPDSPPQKTADDLDITG